MATNPFPGTLAAACMAALLASCSSTAWQLSSSGYSLNVAPFGNEFTVAVHRNQLKALGGNIDSADFHFFVSERLKWNGVCANGWQRLECVDAVTCTEERRHWVLVTGRCLPT